MLHKLSFRNFYSFKEKVTIDFLVDQHAPDTDAYFTDAQGNRITKIMTVIGANASGKTNLLKSISFLKWFITDSFSSLEPKEDIAPNFKPFLFCSDREISSFELVFGIQGEVFEYKLDLTSKFVINESLRSKNPATKKWGIIFTRSKKEHSDEYESNYSKLEVPSDFEKLVRKNSSALSAARQINNPAAVKITQYFSNTQTNITSFDSGFGEIISVAEFFHKQPRMKDRAEKILKRFDLGLSKFEIQEFKQDEQHTYYLPRVFHEHSDDASKHASTWMYEESGGTQNLFVLLKDILIAL